MSKRKKTDLDTVLAPASKPVNVERSRHDDSKIAKPEKVKNTFHFSPEAAWALDELQLEIRRLTGKKVSKSEVLETALLIASEEWKVRKESSLIAIKMAK